LLARPSPLLLAEYQIQRPAAADVFPRLAAVAQEGPVRAAGLFEGVREDGQLVERLLLVEGPGHAGGRGPLRTQPGGIEPRRPEGVAEKLAQQLTLAAALPRLAPRPRAEGDGLFRPDRHPGR